MNVARLRVGYTNAGLIDVMRRLKEKRQLGENVISTCVITGFDNDRRELGEIPEVRAFCRRLVGRGFIAWLDLSTSIEAYAPASVAGEWPAYHRLELGAFEVWAISEGHCQKPGTHALPVELLDQFRAALSTANQKADELLA
jgi:hypothetical protein